ncbi:STAS/SEC14 domain-containing protein [Alkalicoccus halolimnae]|uniref:STAS/SEC14 domain-containing protein n=1 Tax=Alkalicoccus halolimnae TaxID=1667239 RepID=A0AAJ8LSZ2_9BACI|nr:STAS/SEC14 domain-containing protein [Alkalicoccus halolimnae]
MNKILSWSRDNVLAIEFDSKIEEKEYKEMTAEVEKLLEKYDKIKVLTKVSSIEGAELSTMKDRLEFIVKNNMKQIEKYAMVGEQAIVKTLSKSLDIISSPNVRQFDFDEEEKAKEWILKES